jgi:uncharacterized protein (TIGR03435 family)
MFIRYLPGGGVRITGASLKNLISVAYNVRAFQISGGSQWVYTEPFDIEARAATSDVSTPTDPSKMSEEQRKANERLKSLLASRFQLTLHPETKEQPVYALIVSKGGTKLRESTEARGLIRRMDRGTLKGQAVGLGMLALNLSNELGRRVIDKTGLTGKYDFELKWIPIQPSSAPLSLPPQTSESALGADPGPSIFTALQEQLGLRLESEKGAVEVLIIDRAERPSKN